MAGDPTPALTGRRRTRPTSIGCRNPWQPKPGRAPLTAAQAAVQTNRATSVCGLGHGLRLAVVDGFKRGEFVRVLQDQVADLVQEASARRRRHARPGGALEGATGGLHGEIDIGLITLGDTGDNLAGRRVRNLEGLARLGGDPFAVDKKVALV